MTYRITLTTTAVKERERLDDSGVNALIERCAVWRKRLVHPA
ncbi:MAG TPA: hypothetical protein PLD25_26635 [Chloroflexota bacterium]|nr:hypothetical protein [Chloroflexota bacterium]HUM67705.1 hypothetical protein [Chloroflexota bacterium]